MQKSKVSIQDICSIAIMTAVTSVMAQIAIPMPMGVPMTMQTFAVSLAGIVLGAKRGALSMLIYLLIGAVGVPVFSNFGSGIQVILSPTGGFLLSFPLMAYLIGIGAEMRRKKGMYILLFTLGTSVNYVAGVLFFCFITKSSVIAGITACVLPFIPTAVIKAIGASVLGIQIRARLITAMQWKLQ